MATVKVRTRRDGTPTYRVVWRDGGSRDGLWESETFATKRDAARFRRDVDLAGQRWPEGWVAVHRRGGRVPGVIHHSDRGGEYSSHTLERELRRHGALASMGSVADCFDNALAESVFATLERELFDQQPGGRFVTRREAKIAVFDYLETFYNPRRRHSALGQISPAEFEAKHALEHRNRHTVSTAA